MAYKFEDKFVHFRWSNELIGKKCFCADNLVQLEENVKEQVFEIIVCDKGGVCPFGTKRDRYKFCYYDPNYEAKIAYEEGKQIQCKGSLGVWIDDINPQWSEELQYRIKPAEVSVVLLHDKGFIKPTLCWTDKPVEKVYFTGTKDACTDYIKKHEKFAPIMKAFEEGLKIEYKDPVSNDWCLATLPDWNDELEYRVKPVELKWTDLEIGDVIETFENVHKKALVTLIEYDDDAGLHIFAGRWMSDKELEHWKKIRK